MDRTNNTIPSGHRWPIEGDEAKLVQLLEETLEGFSRSVCLQRQTLAILAHMNDAICESPVASEAIEAGVSRLIVERLLKPGDSNQTGIGEEGER